MSKKPGVMGKKGMFSGVLILMCVFFLSSPAPADGPNLVLNPSFEVGGASPTDWDVRDGVGTTASAQDGVASLSLNVASASAPRQTVTVEVGKTYDISCWIDASQMTTGPAVFDTWDEYDPAGQFVVNSANTGWEYFSGSFTATDTEVTIRMFTEATFAGTVYFDNIVIAEQGVGGNTSSEPLIAHYIFGDGNLTDDSSTLNHTLTLGGGAANVTTNTDGISAHFDGSGGADQASYLQNNMMANGERLEAFTVSFWWKTDTLAQDTYDSLISSVDNESLNDWQMDCSGSDLRLYADNGTLTTPIAALSADTWYHTAIISDGSSVSWYLTEEGAGSVNLAGSMPAALNLQDLRIGANRAGNLTYSSDIANVRVYNSQNVSAEALFNEGTTAGPLADPAGVNDFSADKSFVSSGAAVTLSWDVFNADSVSIDQGIGDVTSLTTDGLGQIMVNPTDTTTYTLTVSNSTHGTAQATVTVNVVTMADRPNIVLFLVDDMGIMDTSVPFIFDDQGQEQSCNFNNLYHTPAMETLAANGMRFSNAYAQSVCSPTRTSLMTGLNATGHGVTCWVNQLGTAIGANAPTNYLRKGMTGTESTLPQWLDAENYHSISAGKAHFTWEWNSSVLDTEETPLFIGFDENIGGSWLGQPGSYLGTDDYASVDRPSWLMPGLEDHFGSDKFLTEAITIEANEAVTAAASTGNPFFLYLSHYALHAPFATDPTATNDYSAISGDAYDYATMIEGVDQSLNDLLTHLNNLGIAENTLIIFMGDNGSDNPLTNHETLADAPYNDFPLRGKKGGEWEGGTKVPLIIAWAKPDPTNSFQQALPIAPNSVEHDIVACWDVPVTIASVAGVAAPPSVHGHDLSGYLSGTPGTHRPQEILLYSPHGRNGDYFANYRRDDWKLIYRWQEDSFALYNLADDPTETNDLAAIESAQVLSMARGMAQRFDAEWGTLGTLWPTFGPLVMDNITGSLDLDGDGLIDANEDVNGNGLVDPGETNPDDPDSDDDGSDDNTEVRLGLDPLDPAQKFVLFMDGVSGSDVSLRWPSASGTLFNIYSTDDLLATWTIESSNVPGETVTNETSTLLPAVSGSKFYKIELQ